MLSKVWLVNTKQREKTMTLMQSEQNGSEWLDGKVNKEEKRELLQ